MNSCVMSADVFLGSGVAGVVVKSEKITLMMGDFKVLSMYCDQV